MILRPRHFRAIELLAGTDLLQRDVARQVGVHRKTLGRWLKDETFRAELNRRRDAMPGRLDALRMQTVRSLLVDVIRRLESGEERLPLKEMTQLLAHIREVQEAAARAREEKEQAGDSDLDLTPEQAEKIWAIIEPEEAPDAKPDAGREPKPDAAPAEPQPVQAAS